MKEPPVTFPIWCFIAFAIIVLGIFYKIVATVIISIRREKRYEKKLPTAGKPTSKVIPFNTYKN
jgi:hypothetical protein